MRKRISIAEEHQYRYLQSQTRRHFLKQCTTGLGALALGGLVGCNHSAGPKGMQGKGG